MRETIKFYMTKETLKEVLIVAIILMVTFILGVLIVKGLDYEFEHYIKGNEISTVR